MVRNATTKAINVNTLLLIYIGPSEPLAVFKIFSLQIKNSDVNFNFTGEG